MDRRIYTRWTVQINKKGESEINYFKSGLSLLNPAISIVLQFTGACNEPLSLRGRAEGRILRQMEEPCMEQVDTFSWKRALVAVSFKPPMEPFHSQAIIVAVSSDSYFLSLVDLLLRFLTA